jgi:RecB family exonuclease
VENLRDKFAKAKPEFTMGQHVHGALKTIFSDPNYQKISIKKSVDILRQDWRNNRNGFKSRDEEANFGQRAIEMVKVAIKDQSKNTPTFFEHHIQSEITDDILLSGRIDRIDLDENKGLHLIDYKTSRYNPEYVDKSQLLTYAVLVSRAMDQIPAEVSYWYLEQNDRFAFSPDQADITAMESEIVNTVSRIQADKQLSASPGMTCKWCEFVDICPIGREWKMEDRE